jgi:hypothetical protein
MKQDGGFFTIILRQFVRISHKLIPYRRIPMNRIGLYLITLLFLAGCAAEQSFQISTTLPPAEPLPTHTPETAENSESPPLYTINFDDSECTSNVPEILPKGKYSFLITNNSDTEVAMLIAQLSEGTTFQDLLDNRSEPREFYAEPYHARTPIKLAQRTDDTLGGKFYIFSFYEEGEYETVLMGLNLDGLWSCAPFNIVAE